jgi:hypothetical protein
MVFPCQVYVFGLRYCVIKYSTSSNNTLQKFLSLINVTCQMHEKESQMMNVVITCQVL